MKTEFKGTPPPWHLSIPKHIGKWAGFNTAQGKCYGIYATNDDLEAVAMVFKDELMVHNEQDHLANAKLIAVAPELALALQKFCDKCNEYNIEMLVPEYAMTILEKALS